MTSTVVISAEEVLALLTMEDAISAVEAAMIAVSSGDCTMPPRLPATMIEDSATVLLMAAASTEMAVYAVKSLTLHPANPPSGLPLVHGTITLFDHVTGYPVAIMDGASVTALRTAAASAVATKWLAPRTAQSLGILGTGVQARHHICAITAVRPIRRVVIWGRSAQKARALAESFSESEDWAVTAVNNADRAANCDIVCTTTSARTPILQGEWLRAGSHVNLVGGHHPSHREADTNLIRQAKLFVDRHSAAMAEAGDILIPIQEGAITTNHVIGEIGDVITGTIPGRTRNDEITLYKSIGVAVQDLFVASRILKHARIGHFGKSIQLTST